LRPLWRSKEIAARGFLTPPDLVQIPERAGQVNAWIAVSTNLTSQGQPCPGRSRCM
jgi:hypothetical protein